MFNYRSSVGKLLKMYKYQRLTGLEKDLKKYLEYYVTIDPFNCIKNLFASSLSLIVPIASTPKTLLQRGFWPTLRLASMLAKILAEKGHLVTVAPLLKKGKGGGRQASLAAPLRSIAPKFSFYVDYRTATHTLSKLSMALVRQKTSEPALREKGRNSLLYEDTPTPRKVASPPLYLSRPSSSLHIVLFDDVITTGATIYYAYQTIDALCILLRIKCQVSAITFLKNPKAI